MPEEHPAQITWPAALLQKGLPSFSQTTDPAWFWDDDPQTSEGWSLTCRFAAPPREQGNPSRAQVHFVVIAAPHHRLTAGTKLRLFEPATREYATVTILD